MFDGRTVFKPRNGGTELAKKRFQNMKARDFVG